MSANESFDPLNTEMPYYSLILFDRAMYMREGNKNDFRARAFRLYSLYIHEEMENNLWMIELCSERGINDLKSVRRERRLIYQAQSEYIDKIEDFISMKIAKQSL